MEMVHCPKCGCLCYGEDGLLDHLLRAERYAADAVGRMFAVAVARIVWAHR